MKITSPIYGADGNPLVYELTSGPRGWLVQIDDELDGANHCTTMEEAITSIVNHTADLARGVFTDYVLGVAKELTDEGLTGDDVLQQLTDKLNAKETP